MELIHLHALAHLVSFLFPTAFICRLPQPTSVADYSVAGFRFASGTTQQSDY
jgi:hypothetical protein